MNREELIEKAADAMFTANDGQPNQGYDDMARAALAVFEQAHTPTDDEREAPVSTSDVAAIIDRAMRPWGLSNIGTHSAARALFAAGFHRSVQGEPTDAQVLTAYRAHIEARMGRTLHDAEFEATKSQVEITWLRAALRAAAATQTGEGG